MLSSLPTETRPRRSWHISSHWVTAFVLLLIILALWIPFGFHIGFSDDDWFFYINARNGIAWAVPARPLIPVPFLLAYAIAPGSFVGFNLFLIALLWSRSWLCYCILRKIGAGQLIAFAGAVVVTLIPADTGVFYMSAIAVYFAWNAYLLAVYLLISYWKRPRLSVMALLWCAQIMSLGIYEAPYPLIILTPLILLLVRQRPRRQWTAVLVRWYLFPVLNGIRVISLYILSPGTLNYQTGLINGGAGIQEMLGSFARMLERHYVTGWIASEVTPGYWLLAAIIGILVFGVCFWLGRSQSNESRHWHWWLLVIGVVVTVLGMIIYLPTSLRDVTMRTYYASSVGSALSIIAGLWLVVRRRIPFAICVGILAVFGSAQLLQQHDTFVVNTQTQQRLLAQVAASVPSIAPESALLIMDESTDRNLVSFFSNRWHFQNPFLVMYDDPTLAVSVCFPDDVPQSTSAYCIFRADGVEVRISTMIVWTRPYENVVLVRYTAEHQFVLAKDLAPYGNSPAYQPERLIDFASPPPEAVRRMFSVGDAAH